jgi:hypothetical protein
MASEESGPKDVRGSVAGKKPRCVKEMSKAASFQRTPFFFSFHSYHRRHHFIEATWRRKKRKRKMKVRIRKEIKRKIGTERAIVSESFSYSGS